MMWCMAFVIEFLIQASFLLCGFHRPEKHADNPAVAIRTDIPSPLSTGRI